MTAVQNGQIDATLQDLPAARFYRDRFPGLELAGPPESHGYYVIYIRNGRPRPPRRARPGPRPADRLGRAAAALRAVRHLDRGPARAGRVRPARSRSVVGPARATAAGSCSASYRLAAARRGAGDDRALGRARCRWRWRSACSIALGRLYGPAPRPHGAGRLRRAAPRHAADAPALRPLLPAEAAALGRRDRRAGDQLFGLRGRDLPRRAAGDPRRADGGRAGAGDVAAAWPCGG